MPLTSSDKHVSIPVCDTPNCLFRHTKDWDRWVVTGPISRADGYMPSRFAGVTYQYIQVTLTRANDPLPLKDLVYQACPACYAQLFPEFRHEHEIEEDDVVLQAR